MTKIAKAMNIVAKFEGRLPSRKIREKIASQCAMSPNGAATYYYTCRNQLPKQSKKRKAA